MSIIPLAAMNIQFNGKFISGQEVLKYASKVMATIEVGNIGGTSTRIEKILCRKHPLYKKSSV